MKTSLLKSYLYVWFFWWAVLFFFFGDMRPEGVALIPSFFNGLLLAILACVFGFITKFTLVYKDIQDAKHELLPTNTYGLKCTLAALPPPFQHPRAESFTIPSDLVAWYSSYKKEHPLYADVFEAVLLMYEANPIPASPIKGGHGGLSLRDHSFNVLREILLAKRNYSYIGSKTASGRIRHALEDKTYVFDNSDPAVPLLGFIHDLGKLNCYKLLPNGFVDEVKLNHDVQGSRILANIPEFRELTLKNQPLKDRLCVIMAYYHHPVEMPLWADDHTRALTELLIVADNSASQKEGGYRSDYIDLEMEANNQVTGLQAGYLKVIAEGQAETEVMLEDDINEAKFEQAGDDSDDVTGQVVDEPSNQNIKPSVTAKIDTKAVHPKYVPANSTSLTPGFIEKGISRATLILGETLFNKLKEGVYQHSSLMDTTKGSQSIGFVKGDYFYFHDKSMREHLRIVTGDAQLTIDRSGHQNPYSLAICAYLMSKNWLYCVHDGLNYSSNRAAFTVRKSKVADGKIKSTDVKFMMVVNKEAFAHDTSQQKIAETKLRIEILGGSWGANSDFKLKSDSREIENVKDSMAELIKSKELVDNDNYAESVSVSTVEPVSEKPEPAPIEVAAPDKVLDFDPLDFALYGTTPPVDVEPARTVDTVEAITPVKPETPVVLTEVEPVEQTNVDVAVAVKPEVKIAESPAISDSDEVEYDEDSYIPENERFGILAVVAKLQYANNKKLSPIEQREVKGRSYLYYDMNEICTRFNYTKEDLTLDIKSYRTEHGARKIGTQILPSGVFSVYFLEGEIN